MDTARLSEISINLYLASGCHTPGDGNIRRHHRDNLRSDVKF